MANRLSGMYHGTGDVFASALTAALMNGQSLQAAARVAVDYTVDALTRSHAAKSDPRCGVDFEGSIPKLLQLLHKI